MSLHSLPAMVHIGNRGQDTIVGHLSSIAGTNDFHILTTGHARAPAPDVLANLARVTSSSHSQDSVALTYEKFTATEGHPLARLMRDDAADSYLQPEEHWRCRTHSKDQAFQAYVLARSIDDSAKASDPRAVTVTAYGKNAGVGSIFAVAEPYESRFKKAVPGSAAQSAFRANYTNVASSGSYPCKYFGRPMILTPSEENMQRWDEERRAERARNAPSEQQTYYDYSHSWP